MDPRFQTSFIPKKPIVSQPDRAPSAVNLFSLLATILFIVSLALSGGVFFYKQFIVKQITESKITLERAKDAFEPETINQIIRLDTRLDLGKKLLSSHQSVTPFFDFLSSVTLKTVRFKEFNFAYLAKDKIQVVMKGQARNYAAVALQSDLFNAQKSLKNVIISDMALEAAGTVSFSVSATVDSRLVSYSASLNADGSNALSTTTPQQ